MDGSYRTNPNLPPENIGFADEGGGGGALYDYDENGEAIYYDASDRDRTDVLKLVLYDLNSAIAPREVRLMALHAALDEFDHDDEALHDEELELRADHILLQKLAYATCVDPGGAEVGLVCSALESVYRAGRGRLAQSFHEICDALLPLFVEMIRPPKGYDPSAITARAAINDDDDGDGMVDAEEGGADPVVGDYDLLNKSNATNVVPPDLHGDIEVEVEAYPRSEVEASDQADQDDLSFVPNFTPQTDGRSQRSYYGDEDEESAESVEIPMPTGGGVPPAAGDAALTAMTAFDRTNPGGTGAALAPFDPAMRRGQGGTVDAGGGGGGGGGGPGDPTTQAHQARGPNYAGDDAATGQGVENFGEQQALVPWGGHHHHRHGHHREANAYNPPGQQATDHRAAGVFGGDVAPPVPAAAPETRGPPVRPHSPSEESIIRMELNDAKEAMERSRSNAAGDDGARHNPPGQHATGHAAAGIIGGDVAPPVPAAAAPPVRPHSPSEESIIRMELNAAREAMERSRSNAAGDDGARYNPPGQQATRRAVGDDVAPSVPAVPEVYEPPRSHSPSEESIIRMELNDAKEAMEKSQLKKELDDAWEAMRRQQQQQQRPAPPTQQSSIEHGPSQALDIAPRLELTEGTPGAAMQLEPARAQDMTAFDIAAQLEERGGTPDAAMRLEQARAQDMTRLDPAHTAMALSNVAPPKSESPVMNLRGGGGGGGVASDDDDDDIGESQDEFDAQSFVPFNLRARKGDEDDQSQGHSSSTSFDPSTFSASQFQPRFSDLTTGFGPGPRGDAGSAYDSSDNPFSDASSFRNSVTSRDHRRSVGSSHRFSNDGSFREYRSSVGGYSGAASGVFSESVFSSAESGDVYNSSDGDYAESSNFTESNVRGFDDDGDEGASAAASADLQRSGFAAPPQVRAFGSSEQSDAPDISEYEDDNGREDDRGGFGERGAPNVSAIGDPPQGDEGASADLQRSGFSEPPQVRAFGSSLQSDAPDVPEYENDDDGEDDRGAFGERGAPNVGAIGDPPQVHSFGESLIDNDAPKVGAIGEPPEVKAFGESMMNNNTPNDETLVNNGAPASAISDPPQVQAFGNSVINNDGPNVRNDPGFDDVRGDQGFGGPPDVSAFDDSLEDERRFDNARDSGAFSEPPVVQAFDDEFDNDDSPRNQGFGDAPGSQGFGDRRRSGQSFSDGRSSGQGLGDQPAVPGFSDASSSQGFRDSVASYGVPPSESARSSAFDSQGGFGGDMPDIDEQSRTTRDYDDDSRYQSGSNSDFSGFERKSTSSDFRRDGPAYRVEQSGKFEDEDEFEKPEGLRSSAFDEHGGFSGGAPRVFKGYDDDGQTISTFQSKQSKGPARVVKGYDDDGQTIHTFHSQSQPKQSKSQARVVKGYDDDGQTIHTFQSQSQPQQFKSQARVVKGYDDDGQTIHTFQSKQSMGPPGVIKGYNDDGQTIHTFGSSQLPQPVAGGRRNASFDGRGSGFDGGSMGPPGMVKGYNDDGQTIHTFQSSQLPQSVAGGRSNASFDGRGSGQGYESEAASQSEKGSVYSSARGSGFGGGASSQFSGDHGNQYSDNMSGADFPTDGPGSNMSGSSFHASHVSRHQSDNMSGSGFSEGQDSRPQLDVADGWPDQNEPALSGRGSMGGGSQGQFNNGWNDTYGMHESATGEDNNAGNPNPSDFPEPNANGGPFRIDDDDAAEEAKYADFPFDQGTFGQGDNGINENGHNDAYGEEDIFHFQEPPQSQTTQDYFNYSDPVENGEVCPLAVRKVIKILRYFSRVLSAMEPLAQQSGLVDALLYHMTKKPRSTDYEDEISSRVDAIAVVVNLACAEENKIMLVYHPGLLDAVINIANHDPIDEAREHAAIVLMNLAYAEENKVHMVNQDHLLDTLVHLLSDVSPFTRRYASAALFTLACTYANTAVMARHCDGGILEALRKVLLNDPIDEARVNAAEALFNMARNNSDDTVENMGNHPRLLASLSHSVLTDYSADVRAYSARALEWLSADIHHPMPCHRILLKALTTASQWTKTTCVAEALKMQASLSENRKPMVEHPGLLDALATLSLLDGITDDEVKTCAISAVERLSKEASTRHIMVKNEGVMTALTKATFVEDGSVDDAPEDGTPNALLMKTALKNLAEHM